MKKVKLKYGSETHELTVPSGHTVGQCVANITAKVVLGYGDNVKALVSGVEQPMDAIPSDGSQITLETRLNQKAN